MTTLTLVVDERRLVPANVSELGRKAEKRFVEFFTAHLRVVSQ